MSAINPIKGLINDVLQPHLAALFIPLFTFFSPGPGRVSCGRVSLFIVVVGFVYVRGQFSIVSACG